MDPKLFYGGYKSTVRDIPDNSEDDMSDSDDETFGVVPDTESHDDYTEENENTTDIPIPEMSDSDSEDDMPLSERLERLKEKKKKKKLLDWHNEELKFSDADTAFLGNLDLPPEITELDSPIQFFEFFITNEILDYIVDQSCVYSTQQCPTKPLALTVEDLEQFIGIVIYMSVAHLPATRMYWSTALKHTLVADVMSCNKFEKIKRFLHFNNNYDFIPAGNNGHDKLFKIRPLLSKLRERLLKVPKEEFMAVDEQIIPTKARSNIKQYNPKKPHKWGYKAFVLSGISGFSYDYEIYAGAQSNIVENNFPDLGVSSNVVVRLTKTVPRYKNYKIFADNWFNSVPLMTYLHKEGCLLLGTVRKDRVPNLKIPKESVMKKSGRGAIIEKVADVDGVPVSVTCWYDNKVVTMMSTYVGSTPVSEVQRFSKKDKTYITIPRPKAVSIYNQYMGGVDLLDSMLGYYRIKLRSKKWYMRIFFHLIDLACVNAWILWKRTHPNVPLALKDFKLALAECLTKANKSLTKPRGRPKLPIEGELQAKKHRGPTTDSGS